MRRRTLLMGIAASPVAAVVAGVPSEAPAVPVSEPRQRRNTFLVSRNALGGRTIQCGDGTTIVMRPGDAVKVAAHDGSIFPPNGMRSASSRES